MELDIFAVCWDNVSCCLGFITEMTYQEMQSYVQAYQDIPDLSEIAIKRMIMTAYFCSALLIGGQSGRESDAQQKLDDDLNSAQMEPMQMEEQPPVQIAVGEEQTSPGEDTNLMERSILIVRPHRKLTVTDGVIKTSKPQSKPLLEISLKGPAIPQAEEQRGQATPKRARSTSAEGDRSDSQSNLPLDHYP